MPFSEKTKSSIKEKANFTCCWCNDRMQKVEIHHIIPQADGGTDDESNGAPLCSNCHTNYGGNPELRKEIRLRRDHWFGACASGKCVPHLAAQDQDDLETLHGVIVRLARKWQAIRTPLEIEYTRDDCGEPLPDPYKPISSRLDEIAETLDFKSEVEAFTRFAKHDYFLPFRRAYHRMSQELQFPHFIQFDGIIGHDDKPFLFTSYHDVTWRLLIMANAVLNLPYTIKSIGKSEPGKEGPRLAEIIGFMEIEATFMGKEEFRYVEYVKTELDDAALGE